MIRKLVWMSAAVSTMVGCQSVNDFQSVGEKTRAGGTYDAAVKDEQAKQKALATEKTRLEDEKIVVTRDLQRVDQRIQAAQVEGVQRDTDLKDALQRRRITQEQYAALKKEQSSIQASLGALQIKDSNDRKKALDPAAEQAKKKQLEALEQRQAVLEKELAKALGK